MQAILDYINQSPLLVKTISSVLGIIVVNALARILRHSISNLLQNNESRYGMRKMITYLGYFASLLLVAAIFSDQMGNLTVALGVAGAGIAFALQEVIASLAGWLALSFGHFYHVGDRVQLGGSKGDVIDIGILRTTIMEMGEWVSGDLYNGRIVRIANSFVFKEPVYNYSADFPFVWDEIKIPVKYGSDIHRAREIFERVSQEVVGDYVQFAQETWKNMYRKYAVEHASVQPMVTVRANDNWIEFTMRYVVDYKQRRSTMNTIFTRILEEISGSDGAVEIASATFHLVELPDLNVNLNDFGVKRKNI